MIQKLQSSFIVSLLNIFSLNDNFCRTKNIS